MKKSRLLLALLVLLVGASGYAQDSYRLAVKDYLIASDQFEKTKSIIPTISKLFVGDGTVDVGQLTQRYLDERFEDDITESFTNMMMLHNMTEADIKEVASLLVTPEGKAYQVHQQEWMTDFLTNYMVSFMSLFEEVEDPSDMNEIKNHGSTIKANADIDDAYAAKFKDVLLDSEFGKRMLDAMLTRMDEMRDSTYEGQESGRFYKEWIVTNVPTILLNSAYGNLTLEDLDYAAKLYSNEAYRKLENFGNTAELDYNQITSLVSKFMDWMKSQGTKVTEDPMVLMEFWNSMMGIDKVNDEPKKPWYDFNLDE